MTKEPPEPHADGQQPTMERGGLWGLFFAAAGLLLQPFGVLLSILGIFQGRRARQTAKENSSHAPGALLSMIVGWIGVVFTALFLSFYAMVWDEYSAYQECSARALTTSSQTDCDDMWQQEVAERTGMPEEFVPVS